MPSAELLLDCLQSPAHAMKDLVELQTRHAAASGPAPDSSSACHHTVLPTTVAEHPLDSQEQLINWQLHHQLSTDLTQSLQPAGATASQVGCVSVPARQPSGQALADCKSLQAPTHVQQQTSSGNGAASVQADGSSGHARAHAAHSQGPQHHTGAGGCVSRPVHTRQASPKKKPVHGNSVNHSVTTL